MSALVLLALLTASDREPLSTPTWSNAACLCLLLAAVANFTADTCYAKLVRKSLRAFRRRRRFARSESAESLAGRQRGKSHDRSESSEQPQGAAGPLAVTKEGDFPPSQSKSHSGPHNGPSAWGAQWRDFVFSGDWIVGRGDGNRDGKSARDGDSVYAPSEVDSEAGVFSYGTTANSSLGFRDADSSTGRYAWDESAGGFRDAGDSGPPTPPPSDPGPHSGPGPHPGPHSGSDFRRGGGGGDSSIDRSHLFTGDSSGVSGDSSGVSGGLRPWEGLDPENTKLDDLDIANMGHTLLGASAAEASDVGALGTSRGAASVHVAKQEVQEESPEGEGGV